MMCRAFNVISYSFIDITDEYNSIFPMNILLIMLSVILSAYALHVIGGLVAQTLTPSLIDGKKS